MAQAELNQTVAVDSGAFFEAVTRYEDYPAFVDGCTRVEVDRTNPSRVRVTYHVSMIKEISYTLEHTANPETGIVTWSLVTSDFVKKNVGRWEITFAGAGKAQVKYAIDIEFKIPVPSLILNRLVKSSLPSMVASFEKQAVKQVAKQARK